MVQDSPNIQPFLVNSTSRPRCPLRCGSIYNLHEPLLPDCFLTSNILFLKQPCFLESTFENHIDWVILELWRNGIPWASNRKGMEHSPNDISMTKIPRELWNVCCVICDLGVRICDCEPSCDNVWHSSVTMTQLMARNAGLTRHYSRLNNQNLRHVKTSFWLGAMRQWFNCFIDKEYQTQKRENKK